MQNAQIERETAVCGAHMALSSRRACAENTFEYSFVALEEEARECANEKLVLNSLELIMNLNSNVRCWCRSATNNQMRVSVDTLHGNGTPPFDEQESCAQPHHRIIIISNQRMRCWFWFAPRDLTANSERRKTIQKPQQPESKYDLVGSCCDTFALNKQTMEWAFSHINMNIFPCRWHERAGARFTLHSATCRERSVDICYVYAMVTSNAGNSVWLLPLGWHVLTHAMANKHTEAKPNWLLLRLFVLLSTLFYSVLSLFRCCFCCVAFAEHWTHTNTHERKREKSVTKSTFEMYDENFRSLLLFILIFGPMLCTRQRETTAQWSRLCAYQIENITIKICTVQLYTRATSNVMQCSFSILL